MKIRELETKAEMLDQIELIRELYPELSLDYYTEMLESMMKNNYGQIAVFEGTTCIAISGYWLGTKLWCGKYLELDNVIVSSAKRGTGAGKLMQDYLEKKAKAEKCNILVLDAYANNYKAHRFYYNQGYAPKGFHFIKQLPEGKIT
jgi:GNAT superfamily N-acetyltransferase